MPATILGDRACGKTTFLALLYTAQIKYSNDKENKDNFRYWISPATTSFMGNLYGNLITGTWPDSTVKGQKVKVHFLYGFKKFGGDLYPDWIIKRDLKNPFFTMNFSVVDVAGEDVTELTETPDGVFYEGLPDEMRKLLDSKVLVILLDVSKITDDPKSDEFKDLVRYDTRTAALISAIAEYNSKEKNHKLRRIFPVFVLTKFDMIDENLLTKMGLSRKFPSMKKPKSRKKFAEKILHDCFRQTLALIRGGQLKKVSFDDAYYAMSFVNTAFDKHGMPSPVVKKRKKGAEIAVDYSYDEYRGLINHFRTIVKQMPDKVLDEQELGKVKEK